MKKIINILLIIPLMLVTGGILSAQQVAVQTDTTVVRTQTGGNDRKNQQQVNTKDQARTQTRGQSQAGTAQGVKKVQSARPDWSKARGARPASVERPSGSRIPKGVGRPGGAKGPGKR